MKNLQIPIIILFGTLLSLFLLFKANFFLDFNTGTFNEVLTPIATVIAFIIYYATLIEMRKSNQQNIKLQKVELIKERIENLRLKLESQKIKISNEFLNRLQLENNFTLVKFYGAYKEIYKEMRDFIEQNKDINEHKMFFFSLCFDYKLYFSNMESILQEISELKFEKLEKNIITESLISLLNDYLYINDFGNNFYVRYDYYDKNGDFIEVKGFDAPFHSLPENKLTSVFKYTGFTKIYDIIKTEKLI